MHLRSAEDRVYRRKKKDDGEIKREERQRSTTARVCIMESIYAGRGEMKLIPSIVVSPAAVRSRGGLRAVSLSFYGVYRIDPVGKCGKGRALQGKMCKDLKLFCLRRTNLC